jgi:hypothetical protein
MNATVREELNNLAASCCDPRNNSKEQLRAQARMLVSFWLSTPCTSTAASRLTADEILAQLLQTLAPAFNASHAARVCALSTLTGALQACHDEHDDKQFVSHGLLTLLGRFLLTHAGPLEHEMKDDEDGIDDDDEELVRDTALIALASLLRTKAAAATDNNLIHIQKIVLAKNGVENRVAVAQDSHSYEYETALDRERGTINGLSLLPRSRRSLCFDLLQACVDGITNATDTSISSTPPLPSLEQELVDLVLFSCNCLHGESDPRCLQQLLLYLRSLLTAVSSYLLRSANPCTPLPVSEVFDAIAPYYPVQFNPPANNPYGITKASLQEALRSVMCFIDYDAQARTSGTDTMLSLSLSIVLEQLLPLPEDEPTTMPEKYDALQDLESLLFGTRLEFKAALLLLDEAALRSISQALAAVHDEASLVVATAPLSATASINTNLAKQTANKCRSLVSKFALECEVDNQAWKVFVAETLQSLSDTIVSSSRSRLSIAYMANLCGCGGLKTMDACLRLGLEPLLNVLGR